MKHILLAAFGFLSQAGPAYDQGYAMKPDCESYGTSYGYYEQEDYPPSHEQHVHRDCLDTWRTTSDNLDAERKCFECNYEYNLEINKGAYYCGVDHCQQYPYSHDSHN